jgi:hypothetical protein
LRSRISALFVFLILALIATGCGGGGGQQEQPEEQGPNKDGAAEKPMGGQETTGAAKKKNVVRGTVEKIDTEGDTLVVKRPNGKTESFKFNPERVKVNADGEKASVEDVKPGQRVAVRFRGEGEKKVARAIITKSGAEGGGTTG